MIGDGGNVGAETLHCVVAAIMISVRRDEQPFGTKIIHGCFYKMKPTSLYLIAKLQPVTGKFMNIFFD